VSPPSSRLVLFRVWVRVTAAGIVQAAGRTTPQADTLTPGRNLNLAMAGWDALGSQGGLAAALAGAAEPTPLWDQYVAVANEDLVFAVDWPAELPRGQAALVLNPVTANVGLYVRALWVEVP
jgi:hypothetical protein